MAAKPTIDIDLIVADPAAETTYLPRLRAAGYRLVLREPHWHEHRMLVRHDPAVNLHVFGPGAPDPDRVHRSAYHLLLDQGRFFTPRADPAG